jgi:recombinational DNA repair protein (RecF pathway)
MMNDITRCAICGKPIDASTARTARPVAKSGLSCDHCFTTIIRPRVNAFIDMVLSGDIPEVDEE